MPSLAFNAGKNIAMKVPAHQFLSTVDFYEKVLRFKRIDLPDAGSSVVFDFGGKNLWIDPKEEISQAEIWLEVETDNHQEAEAYLNEQGCVRCDEIEDLPSGFKGFWVSSPANIIHLVGEGD